MINAFLITLGIIAAVVVGLVGIIILVIIGLCIWAVIDINATYKKHRKEFEENDT